VCEGSPPAAEGTEDNADSSPAAAEGTEGTEDKAEEVPLSSLRFIDAGCGGGGGGGGGGGNGTLLERVPFPTFLSSALFCIKFAFSSVAVIK
jgi:hypothetical protein